MPSKMHNAGRVAHARRMVQQLRIEASIERIKVPLYSQSLALLSAPRVHFFSVWCEFVFPVGVQGFVGPDALLWGTRQERPAAHGPRRF